MRLIETGDLLPLFERRVLSSKKIDIASAWATPSKGLNILVNASRGQQVRSLIGISGRVTNPDALDELANIGELRLPARSGVFHPKLYLFHGNASSYAWIGSANFTVAGGFGQRRGRYSSGNTEILFETRDIEAAAKWFEQAWNDCGEMRSGQLEAYREEWSRNPPGRGTLSNGCRPETGWWGSLSPALVKVL